MLEALDFKVSYYDWKKNVENWKGLEIYSSENSILLNRCINYALSLIKNKKEKEKRKKDLIRYYTTKRITLVAENQSISE